MVHGHDMRTHALRESGLQKSRVNIDRAACRTTHCASRTPEQIPSTQANSEKPGVSNQFRILLCAIGLFLLLPGGCSVVATLPVIGFGLQGMRGEALAAGFLLVGSIAVPVGLICGAWGSWLLVALWKREPLRPSRVLLVATALLLLVPWLGLVWFNSMGVAGKLGAHDDALARALAIVSPMLGIGGGPLLAWQVLSRE